MLFILDAYNVIHKIPELEICLERDLRTARDALTGLCQQLLSKRGDIQQIILVFDGNSRFRHLPQIHPPKIKIVFSETEEDADEKIVDVLEEKSGRVEKVVVSDDNFVRNHARAYKARVMKAAEFYSLIRKTRSRQLPEAGGERKPLAPSLADAITLHYKKALGLSD